MANGIEGVKQTAFFWGFDGKKLTGRTAISLSKGALEPIAKAIAQKHPEYKAVMFAVRGKNFLIMVDGHVLNPPLPMQNQTNDWNFIDQLSKMVGEIGRKLKGGIPLNQPESATPNVPSVKGWININTKQFIEIPLNNGFNDSVLKRMDEFGLMKRPDMTALRARLLAEQRGWVACGINGTDPNNVVVAISALSLKQARIAVTLFAKREGNADHWGMIKITTNDGQHTLKGEQIKEFLKAGVYA
jgi:hypothetical protein